MSGEDQMGRIERSTAYPRHSLTPSFRPEVGVPPSLVRAAYRAPNSDLPQPLGGWGEAVHGGDVDGNGFHLGLALGDVLVSASRDCLDARDLLRVGSKDDDLVVLADS